MQTCTLLAVALISIAAVRGACQLGQLVCQGEDQFGICNFNNSVIFTSVALGTKCVCSGGDDSCRIIAINGGGSLQPPQPSQHSNSTGAASTLTQQSLQSPTPSAGPSSTSSAQSLASTSSQTCASSPSHTTAITPSSGSGCSTNSAGTYIQVYTGTGAPSSGWPSQSQWLTFDSLWHLNSQTLLPSSCSSSWSKPDNSPAEIADMQSVIEAVSQSSGVDARFIFAVMMQESIGCVHVHTTNNGVTNPGLMQSHNGQHSCETLNPCPKEQIRGMIEDGVNGTSDGPGLAQLLKDAGGGNDAQTYYRAARMYNSGRVDASGILEKGGSTHCYVSDVANRLLGWVSGPSGCHL
ncbi:Lysozyme-like domain [Cordyceps militaris]|uniref:Lysozyme-like domain n=1 Tax=Cordyceps militaris TaxID=73501 RepID=A0A2H4SR74_CORMI|nr:Lysozyme-like domain [Cordyceps militaris]